jgi:hypothetical protein
LPVAQMACIFENPGQSVMPALFVGLIVLVTAHGNHGLEDAGLVKTAAAVKNGTFSHINVPIAPARLKRYATHHNPLIKQFDFLKRDGMNNYLKLDAVFTFSLLEF